MNELEVFYREYARMLEKEVDKFKILVNKLINVNYLTAYKEEDKSDYYFICNYFDCFQSYFLLSGRELNHYPNQRTFVLESSFTQRLLLNKKTSFILLLLRLLYNQKMQDISLDNQIMVTVGDIQLKFEQLVIEPNDRIKLGELSEALRLLKRYNIINYKGSDFGNDDFVITVYPTIQFAVGINDMNAIVEKINTYNGKEEEEISED